MTSGAVLAAVLAGLAAWFCAEPRARGGLSRLRTVEPGPSGAVSSTAARRPLGDVARGRVLALLTRRGAADRERALAVEACSALSGELRAGRPPPVALAAAALVAAGAPGDRSTSAPPARSSSTPGGPTGAALRSAAAVSAVGGDVAGVLAAGADRSAAPSLLRGLAACWTLCSGAGAGLAAAVEQLELAERDAEDRRRAVRAELAGPRATARMLAALPLLGLALAAAMGAEPLRFLLGTPLGLACLTGGVALDLLGLAWTSRLVRRAEAAT
jgi:tight adherence protein B